MLISVLFLFSISIPAFASGVVIETEEIETEEERIERVYEEVLTGNITNHSDVIDVALAQYHPSVSLCSGEVTGDITNNDNNLHIQQVLSTTTDTDGTVVSELADSSLVITDEDGNLLSADYVYENSSKNNSNASSTYQVYAVFTMTVQIRTEAGALNPNPNVRIMNMKTTLTYGDTILAKSLQHFYYADRGTITGASTYQQQSAITSNPGSGTYYFTPNDPQTWYPTGGISNVMKGYVTVKVGTTEFSAGCVYRLDTFWGWQ